MMTDITRRAYRDPVAKTANKQGFQKGQSGNPRGRPQGSRNKATIAAMALLGNDLEAITAKLVEKAKEGEAWAVKLVIDKLIPNCKDAPVNFRLANGGDLRLTMAQVLDDTARGKLTPGEALTISQVVTALGIAQTLEELENRLASLQPRSTGKITRG